jgi:hypothetical protein
MFVICLDGRFSQEQVRDRAAVSVVDDACSDRIHEGRLKDGPAKL